MVDGLLLATAPADLAAWRQDGVAAQPRNELVRGAFSSKLIVKSSGWRTPKRSANDAANVTPSELADRLINLADL